MTSKERRKALHKFGNNSSFCWSDTNGRTKNTFNTASNIDNWLLSRTNPGTVIVVR